MIDILIIPNNIPYPLDSGGNIAQYAILEEMQFRKDIRITLSLVIHSDRQREFVESLRKKLPGIEIVAINLCSNYVPLYQRVINKAEQISTRSFDGAKRMFSGERRAGNCTDEFDIPRKINPIKYKSEQFIEEFSKILSRKKFHLVQVEFFEFLDLVNAIPSNIPKVFVHHEIRYKRLERTALISRKNPAYTKYIVGNVRNVEIAQLSKYDRIISFSEIDKRILESDLGNKVVAIPFPVMKEEFNMNGTHRTIDKLMFVGGSAHYPNYEAVKWFIEEVFDGIYKQFQLPFFIIGNWSGEFKDKFEHDSRIVFTGFVHELKDYYTSSISIVPLRVGSGIRAKILYAMAQKSPVISTEIGIEGINAMNGVHYLNAENKDGFVLAIKQLLEQPDVKEDLIRNSFDFVFKNYHPEAIVDERIKSYKSLIGS